MKKISFPRRIVTLSTLALGLVGLMGCSAAGGGNVSSSASSTTAASMPIEAYSPIPALDVANTIKLSSPDIAAGGTIGNAHVFNDGGCTGDNLTPSLEWSGAPEGTKSFAVTVFDPNAPTGSGFWHWVMADIPATATGYKVGDTARNFANDYGTEGYGGPCPPAGDPHNYIFTVYALKTDALPVPEGATNAYARFAIQTNALASGSFVATYGQPE